MFRLITLAPVMIETAIVFALWPTDYVPYPSWKIGWRDGSDYRQPKGLCTYVNGVATGCYCKKNSTEPVVHLNAGYATGAVCAPKRSLLCPSTPGLLDHSVLADGRCYTSCSGVGTQNRGFSHLCISFQSRKCPWPSRCELVAVLGEVCFYPQWIK
ncbi:hypothetical protein FOZ63_025601 [Perkinsus olseni]|uniref:Secreted protein n=1 Tax=Perkinsus olseni TaxID=32597 RepID=A0A7J6UFE8_PEROL|nr:hypothetical protein FOZ63_025601 [Perkinsus olseni]